jgi:AcrR family transcriptional regulator
VIDPENHTVRERLLDAAAAVFAERGYDGTRVGDIAGRAGLSTGAIYSQFENKSDLLMSALVERAAARYEDTVRNVRRRSYHEALLATALAYRQTNEPLLLDAMAAAQRDETLAQRLRDDLLSQEQGSIAFVQAAQDAGHAPRELPATAVARFSTVLRLGTQVLAQLGVAPLSRKQLDALSQRLVYALVRGDGVESDG